MLEVKKMPQKHQGTKFHKLMYTSHIHLVSRKLSGLCFSALVAKKRLLGVDSNLL